MAGPSKIRIPVRISAEDRRLFSQRSPRVQNVYRRIDAIARHGLDIDEEEFFAYALHREWKDLDGWRGFDEFAARVPARRAFFDEYIQNNSGSLKLRYWDSVLTEHLGIGASLGLATRALGLTHADFRAIPVTSRHKTLDFSRTLLAAEESGIFEIECKGTHDRSSLADQFQSIREKKTVKRVHLEGHRFPRVLLGTILDLQHESHDATTLHVVDPPEEESDEAPRFLRLVNRLQYYLEELRVMTRSPMLIALTNRLQAIEALGSIHASLDGLSLVDAKGEPYEGRAGRTAYAVDTRFGVAYGRVYDLRLTEKLLSRRNRQAVLEHPPRLYFRGLLVDAIDTILKQRFDEILGLRYPPTTHGYQLPEEEDEETEGEPTIETGPGGQRIVVLSSGLVAGKVSIPRWNEDHLPRLLNRLRWPKTE